MPTLRILDGTKETKFGNAVVPALQELAKYMPIYIRGPRPGSIDLPGYNLVKEAESRAYDPTRRQVNYRSLVQAIVGHDRFTKTQGVETIVLSEIDFFTGGLNWCFGAATHDREYNGYVVLSTYRLQDTHALTHVVMHELGHLYGAASRGRGNTEENLGSHCTNVCVMEQRITVPSMLQQVAILSGRDYKFCKDCREELRANND